MVKQVTVYETSDGKLYKNEAEALHYETKGKALRELEVLWAKKFSRMDAAEAVYEEITLSHEFRKALHDLLTKLGV